MKYKVDCVVSKTLVPSLLAVYPGKIPPYSSLVDRYVRGLHLLSGNQAFTCLYSNDGMSRSSLCWDPVVTHPSLFFSLETGYS